MFQKYIARLLRRGWGETPYFEGLKGDEITPQVLQQQAQHTSKMVQQLAEEIATLGAKSETYDSSVPVTIELEGEEYDAPDRILGQTECGDSLHGLSVSNPSSMAVQRDDGELIVRNGYALRACGVSEFKSNVPRDYSNDDGETITNFAMLVDFINITNLLQVKLSGTVKFGNTTIWHDGDWTTSSGADTYKVKLTTSTDIGKFLKDHFADFTTGTYNSTQDFLVKASIEGGQLRLFVDSSDVDNFDGATNQSLGHTSSSKTWLDLTTNCSTAP